jgi:uncharacterized protein (DUF433 family)
MQLEDYFEHEKFPTGDRIRLKGTRIAIEHILEPYLEGDSPERIFQSYRRVLTLEQIHATITYYLHNKAEVDAYLDRSRAADAAAYQEHLNKEPPEVVKRLRTLGAETKPRAHS